MSENGNGMRNSVISNYLKMIAIPQLYLVFFIMILFRCLGKAM